LLLSLLAHVSATTTHDEAAACFRRGVALCTELALTAQDMSAVNAINFAGIRAALDRLNQLAPLEKPALIKALLSTAGNTAPLSVMTADVLRAICAAIEVPLPPAVAAIYAAE
jgi:hypothetical protein